MNFLILQPLTPALIPAVVELDRLCLGGMWQADGYRRELESDCAVLRVALGLGSDRSPEPQLLALAALWTILEEAHITLLAVHPDYRQQGLGQALLVELLAAAHQRGMERATLEVRASNQGAIALYEKFGFRSAGTRKRYYQNPEEDALILWRSGLEQATFREVVEQWRETVGDRLAASGWKVEENEEQIKKLRSL